MKFRLSRRIGKRVPISIAAAVVAAIGVAVPVSVLSQQGATAAAVARPAASRAASGLGQLSGLLPRNKLTLESAIQVNLNNETVRLPIYPGEAGGKRVWYVLLDASDAGAPDFSPTRIAEPGPTGFPLAKFQPGAVAGPGYSPFIRIAGSTTVYNAPIIATGDGPFDVVHHTNTADRVLGVHIAPLSPPGQFLQSYADLLFVKGFDAGQPILYLSTDAGQPLTAVLERSTYVPALNKVAYNGGDDFLGSARERLFGFVNGQTGANNPQAQGFVNLVRDGHASEDASADNTALINGLRNGGDLLNVFGDFPTLRDPRHADAYSPLWDAQLGQWTQKAIDEGVNKRQIDENGVFNLAATRPDLSTGPGGAPYGSVGIDIHCAVIGFTKKAPTANLVDPVPNSQFPPR